jgi:gas vesicle protein
METLSFILGIAAGLVIFGVVVMFRMNQSLNKLKTTLRAHEDALQSLHRDITQQDELINRRVDQEVERTSKIYDELYRYIDSRLDKLETKVLSKIPTNKEY